MRFLVAVLIVILLGVGCVASYYWVRDSSLMAVRTASVEGVNGYKAQEIRKRLETAAIGLSTVNTDVSALRAAVADYPTVRSIAVDGQPPHDLTIIVKEDRPLAVLQAGDKRVTVGAGGRLLEGVPAGDVPIVPVRGGLPDGGGVRSETRMVLAALQAAPSSMRGQIEIGGVANETGLTIQLDTGVALRFGDATRLRAKWLAAASVLSDPEAAKATYIDLRAPERPAAGGLQPAAAGAVPAPSPTATTQAQPQPQPEP
jgi:cell division protein FtsQ